MPHTHQEANAQAFARAGAAVVFDSVAGELGKGRFDGRLAHLPVAKVTNLVRTMEELKEAGYWLVGLDERADKSYTEVDYTSPTGIVLGGEGGGLHELTRKRCDFVVSLPTSGPVKSLNVSVASGVVLFEALRQRRIRK